MRTKYVSWECSLSRSVGRQLHLIEGIFRIVFQGGVQMQVITGKKWKIWLDIVGGDSNLFCKIFFFLVKVWYNVSQVNFGVIYCLSDDHLPIHILKPFTYCWQQQCFPETLRPHFLSDEYFWWYALEVFIYNRFYWFGENNFKFSRTPQLWLPVFSHLPILCLYLWVVFLWANSVLSLLIIVLISIVCLFMIWHI